MNFSQPVNSAILVYSNMEQHKPYLEIRNLSSGKDLWCIVHSSAQRKTLFKGFVKNEPRVINTPLKESSLCHKAFLKLFDSSATICTKSIPFFSLKILLSQVLVEHHTVQQAWCTVEHHYLKAVVLRWRFLPHHPIYPWGTLSNVWTHLYYCMSRRMLLKFSGESSTMLQKCLQ